MIRSFSNLLVTRTCIILWMGSNFGQIGPPTTELAALERLRNTPIDLIMGENGVSTFSLLFLVGSFWYFHVTRTSIKAWMSLNFLKWDLTLAHWTQVSDRCPLGYLLTSSILIDEVNNYTGVILRIACFDLNCPLFTCLDFWHWLSSIGQYLIIDVEY